MSQELGESQEDSDSMLQGYVAPRMESADELAKKMWDAVPH